MYPITPHIYVTRTTSHTHACIKKLAHVLRSWRRRCTCQPSAALASCAYTHTHIHAHTCSVHTNTCTLTHAHTPKHTQTNTYTYTHTQRLVQKVPLPAFCGAGQLYFCHAPLEAACLEGGEALRLIMCVVNGKHTCSHAHTHTHTHTRTHTHTHL